MITLKLLFLAMWLADLLNVEAIQTSAKISPGEYIASLDPSARTIFQCEVTGADSILWIVDGYFALRQEIRERGISSSHQITVNQTEGRFTSNISISRSHINKNTSILCMACVIQGTDILSAPAFFKVQGLLGPPPNLTQTILNEFVKVLTWDEPYTLNITDVEPDISHYRVCSNLSTTCTSTTSREFMFVNVGVNILFTVTAVNVVGEGNRSTIMHGACDSNKAATSVSGNEITTRPRLYRKINSAVMVNFTFSQTAARGGNSNCFDVYEVWTTSKSDLISINHGRQIPKITVDHASDVRWITISVDSSTGLRENELYSATINAINEHGHTQNAANINFSTYDVQSVRVLPSNESDVLEFTCTFIRGSQAQGCRLTVCQTLGYGRAQQSQCRNITITRNQTRHISTKTENGFDSRLYTVISEIIEIERDGSETVHGFVPEIDTVYTDPPSVTIHTSATNTSTLVNDGTLGPKFLTIVVGSVTAIIVIVLIISLLLIIMMVILWYQQRFKTTVAVEPEEVVYDEPYPLAMALRPKTELQMEPCPAYGIVPSSRTHVHRNNYDNK